MIVYPKYNFAFQHVNRCGGITITKLLDSILNGEKRIAPPPGNTHQPMTSRINILKSRGIDTDKLNIYINIRNPFSRLVSIYTYRKSHNKYKDISFKEFFYNVYAKLDTTPSGPIHNMTLYNGKVLNNVRFIKAELIGLFWPGIILSHFNKVVKIGKHNTSNHGRPIGYFNQDMINIVIKKDNWVIKNYYPKLLSLGASNAS